jgi:hypothetical protein
MTAPNLPALDALITRAKLLVDAMTPDELTAMIKAQQENWVRGEMGMGETIAPKASVLKESEMNDYAARISNLPPADPDPEATYTCPNCNGTGEIDGHEHMNSPVTTLRAEVARLTAERDAAKVGAVRVKPLVWEGFVSGDYLIEVANGGIAKLWYYSADMVAAEEPELIKGGYLTLVSIDDLKSAANTHNRARILAALEPDTDRPARDLAVARHVLESAAQKAETHGTYPELNVWGGGPEWLKHGKSIAAEIRALDTEALVKGLEG